MRTDSGTLLRLLEVVANERRRRAADTVLDRKVTAVKTYQHERFRRTYVDLLSHPRYEAAARFFLDELYGPRDFSKRDAQFERIVPALVRLFPGEVVETVRDLAELHAITEQMDSRMGLELDDATVTARAYIGAWLGVDQRDRRERQVSLMMGIGSALDRYTRRPLLGHTLRLMRGPAKLAGLEALQHFLELGFDTFGAMKGARTFLEIIASRELALIDALFAAGSADPARRDGAVAACLVQLP